MAKETDKKIASTKLGAAVKSAPKKSVPPKLRAYVALPKETQRKARAAKKEIEEEATAPLSETLGVQTIAGVPQWAQRGAAKKVEKNLSKKIARLSNELDTKDRTSPAQHVSNQFFRKWDDLTPEQQAMVPDKLQGANWNPGEFMRCVVAKRMVESHRTLRKLGVLQRDLEQWVMPLEFLMRVMNNTEDIQKSLGVFMDKNGDVHAEKVTLGLRIEAAKLAAPYLHRRMPIAVDVTTPPPAPPPLLTKEVLEKLSDEQIETFKRVMQVAKQVNEAAYAQHVPNAAQVSTLEDDPELAAELAELPNPHEHAWTDDDRGMRRG